MKKAEKTFVKRFSAYILTGAMIVSNMASSSMTVFASAPENTGGGILR